MRSTILRICCTLALAGGALFLLVPGRAPETDAPARAPDPVWHTRLARTRPDVVLLGNSILNEGLDERAFNRALGARAMKVWSPGASSAWQYIVFKNVLAAGPHKPAVVVTFFRDHYLTEPTFRADGPYRAEIERFATAREPLLDRLAFGREDAGLAGRMLDRKESRKAAVEARIKAWIGRLHRRAPDEVESAIAAVFHEDRQIPALVNERQLRAEGTAQADQLDFAAARDRSFLPEMMRIAREQDIRLIYVRMKRRPGPDGRAFRSAALESYLRDLRDYLAANGAVLLDFGDAPALVLSHYGAGDHLNRAGREVFLPLLTEALAPLLPAGGADRAGAGPSSKNLASGPPTDVW